MLDYENQMFLDVLHEDGLLIAAKGLNIDEVFYSLINVFSDTGNLVLVLGTTDNEAEYYCERFLQHEPHDDVKSAIKPRRINTEYSATQRQKIYREGGVLFVTSRILVVDMLKHRLPIDLVTGILIARAHRIISFHQEIFIMRLYRQENKTGFIKAFSSSPTSFNYGNSLSRVMRFLFLRNVFLWPRFQSLVKSRLASKAPDVIELHLNLSPNQLIIQASLLTLLTFTLAELKRINPSLLVDSDDGFLCSDNIVLKSFHAMLQRELDPIWHRLSWKTRQLVGDLKTLRNLLLLSSSFDCVSFFQSVSFLRTIDNALCSGGWMIHEAAESLFVTAKLRVFGRGKIEDVKSTFEPNPKWNAVSEIMREITEEIRANGLNDSIPSEKILIVTENEQTADQVRDFLALGLCQL